MKSVTQEKKLKNNLTLPLLGTIMLLESPDTGQKERSIRIEKEVDWSPQGGGVHSADVF